MAGDGISVARTRIGILLFLLWWLPVYLLTPVIAGLLGKEDDAPARHTITIWLVVCQTVLGLVGVYLAGRELFSALAGVRRRRVLPVAWRIVWRGDTGIAAEDLKKPRQPAHATGTNTADRAHPPRTTRARVPPARVDGVPANDGHRDADEAAGP